MSLSSCCVKGFQWGGTPVGREAKLGDNNAYITGENNDVAVLFIHDVFGWKFPNIRLLADHFAAETCATVYVPDFFAGEVVPPEIILEKRWEEYDIRTFIRERNSREIREPEIFACARALRSRHRKIAAVGYCYGGWAVMRLGAREHNPPLVDCVSMGHPSLLTERDVDEVAVPVQVLAPEVDQVYTAELKAHTFSTLQKNGIPFNYQHFPGVEHGCFVRGDPNVNGEREAMVRGKNAAVNWFKQYLGSTESSSAKLEKI